MSATPANPPVSDDDIAACAPNAAVRKATGFLIGAGFLTLVTGLQLVTSIRFREALLQGALYVMLIAGAAAMFIGVRLYRMSGWAAPAATGMAAALALGMGYWLVFSFSNGVFTLFGLLAPFFAAAAAFFTHRASPAVRRAAEIRERLQDAGIELGF